MRTKASVFAGLLSLAAQTGRADPTWPAATDHMEEIVFQLQGFKGSLFSDHITPCDNEAAGPGRITASEWLRVGFHDMAPRNKYSDTNGVDASLQFELNDGENTGPGHATTLTIYANYFSSRSSMADLIAAGVYASVRSCGGPVVPLRLGRIDATEGGSGVPQPQNSLFTFQQQFDRMGFNTTEMIQLTACGHTLGHVHSPEFPDLVPASAGQIGLDSSVAAFDNKVAVEYIAGNTTNPLVVGPSVKSGHNSDGRVFAADQNVTMKALTDPNTFSSVCQTVLQKMIEVVPTSVSLTAQPIAPYAVKPVDMQLTLNSGGTTFLLSGYIRVRTTQLPASSIKNVVLTWKDRDGGNDCGSSGCSTTATLQGVATGFDDTFGFFPIQATIPASSGISSFTVVVNLVDGSSQSYDNNGNSYPLTDAVILQKPQSCLLQGTGALTVAALVRNDLAGSPVNLGVSFLVPRNGTDGNPVPALTNATIPLTAGNCVGQYTFYTGSFSIYGGQSYNARLSVSVDSGETVYVDDFNKASDLAGTCTSFSGGAACSNGNSTVSSSSVSSSTGNPSGTASGTSTSATSVPVTSTTGSTSTSTAPTLGVRPTIGGYVFVSCWTEGSGVRALSEASFAYDSMTLESCAANCTGFDYWATEYGRECYCGNSLAGSSAQAAAGDCSMVCAGDATEYCGAGNRLELYSTTATRSTATPTATLAVRPTVGAYTFVGCQTEATSERALSDKTYADDGMTLESCAAYCAGYTYFGTEYGRECYCGNALNNGSVVAAASDCSMTCAGNAYEYCGAGNRLELYSLAATTTSSSGPSITSSPPTTTPTTTPTTPANKPTISPFTYLGCYTEGANGVRALQAASFVSGTDMTLEDCASFCSAYKYFGAEYAGECYCGDALQGGSANASSQADCAMACNGDKGELCGGADRLSLYVQAGVVVPGAPVQPGNVTVTVLGAGAGGGSGGSVTWEWYGCYTEANGVRALAASATAADNMTLEACATFCSGHAYFGAEYGRECYCGDGFGNGSVVAPGTDCSMTCAGNATEFCGAGNRLSVYSAPVLA